MGRPKVERAKVEPGQIWESCDTRDRLKDGTPRKIAVLSLGKEKVMREVVGTKRITYIRADRFRPVSTGYRLLLARPRSVGREARGVAFGTIHCGRRAREEHMKKLEFRGCVEEIKDRKAKGGFKISLGGEVAGLIPWVGVRVFLYVQTEEEAKEFPIGKVVAITVDEPVP